MVYAAGGGLAGFDSIDLLSSTAIYEEAHPSIPGAVMNYDTLIPSVANEPDCSPHPFDILAMYALYQTVR